MAKAAKKAKANNNNVIKVKTSLTADQLLKLALNIPLKNSKTKK